MRNNKSGLDIETMLNKWNACGEATGTRIDFIR